MTRVNLHIDRLVLDEALLRGERADSVRAALERELVRQLQAPGATVALLGLGTVDRLPPARLAGAAPATGSVGARIAAAVGQSLSVRSHPSTRSQGQRK